MGAPSPGADAPCEPLEWDSAHFGFPIARAPGPRLTPETAERIDRWCAEHGIRCLYQLAEAGDPETARIAAARGYRPVDVRITMRRPLEGIERSPLRWPEGMSARDARPDDLDWLRELAASSHEGSRFYFDRGFPRERCDALYVAWVERGFEDPGRTLRVLERDGEPAGFHLLAPISPEGESHGELMAIGEGHRRRGASQALMLSSLRLMASRGARAHRAVVSARNVGAIRFHERLGFLVDSIETWHHKWFDADER